MQQASQKGKHFVNLQFLVFKCSGLQWCYFTAGLNHYILTKQVFRGRINYQHSSEARSVNSKIYLTLEDATVKAVCAQGDSHSIGRHYPLNKTGINF